MKKLFIALLSFLVFAYAPKVTFAADNLLFVFDASGSMLESFGGLNRIQVAKSALSDLLASLDPSIKVGLRPYANVKRATQAEACAQTGLAVPFTTDRNAIRSVVNNLQAVGSYTGTAYALSQAKNDFAVDQDNVLVLLTDGKETCGGDPASATADLLAAGIKVKTYVIGIDLDAEARAQLLLVAQRGGGKYFDATDAATLASSLRAIQDAERPIDKTNTDSPFGTSIRGGNGYDTAVPITPGRYHLDHHQKAKEYDYFTLQVRKDVPVTFEVQAGATGVIYRENTGLFEEGSSNVAAMLQVQNSGRAIIANPYTQSPSAMQSATYTPETDGFVYILVGDSSRSMSKDVTFNIITDSPETPIVDIPDQSSFDETRPENFDLDSLSNISIPEVEGLPLKKITGSILLFIGVGVAIGVAILILLVVVIIKALKRPKPIQQIPPSTPQPPSVPPQTPPVVS